MQKIFAKNKDILDLGCRGEHLARCICFEIEDWKQSYGEGRAELLVRRAGETIPYPANIEQSGNTVRWVLTAADTAKDGLGQIELRYYVGDAMVNSKTQMTRLSSALGEASATPQQSWVDRVLEAEQATQNAVTNPTLERIAVLKRNLRETDYIIIKIAEGVATHAEYAERIAQRQAWRAEIHGLEVECET